MLAGSTRSLSLCGAGRGASLRCLARAAGAAARLADKGRFQPAHLFEANIAEASVLAPYLLPRRTRRCLYVGLCALIVAIIWPAARVLAKQPPRDMVRRFTVEQWERFRPLFALVEEASTGHPVPSDVTMAWQSDVLKAEAGVNFVPFTLKVPRGGFTSFPLAMYLRVVQRGSVATAPGPRDALAQYPFEDVAFFSEPSDGRISRAFAAPPGQWDVYVALREAQTSDAQLPKTVVFKREVDVPDLSTDLTVSSIITADKIEVDGDSKRPDFEDQLDDPYRLWGMRITPALETRFDRSKTLSVTFLVYNTGSFENDKPDVEIDYTVFQRSGKTETFFGKTNPQLFNSHTLPSDFSLSAGHLLVGGQAIPLARFPDGDFRLEITVTDKTSGRSLRRDVNFTVADH
jgi:hypothetical protein